MKQIFILISICILILSIEPTFAQTASDYFLPLNVGSYIYLQTTGGPGWEPRSTTYITEGTDLISGKQYFRQVGREIPSYTSIFQVVWLRKDSVGNVAMGAWSDGTTNVDSATSVTANWFPNEFLTKGYFRTYSLEKMETGQDSVLSVTETVGAFNNCLKISDTHFDSTGKAIFREYKYYAFGVGIVKCERTLPESQAHIDQLTGYGTTGVSGDMVNQTPRGFSLSQNYPNPFNPSTVINYQVARTGMVSLRVFDLLGKEVATLVNEVKSAGSYSAIFTAANFPSGVYFYQLKMGSFTETKRLVLLK